MINDLDKTLQVLLERELPPELVSPKAKTRVTISFDTPDDQFHPSSATLPVIDLFLYDLRENLELRSNEWIEEPHSSGMALRKRFDYCLAQRERSQPCYG